MCYSLLECYFDGTLVIIIVALIAIAALAMALSPYRRKVYVTLAPFRRIPTIDKRE